MNKDALIDDLRWVLRRADQDSGGDILATVLEVLRDHDGRTPEEQEAGLAARRRRFLAAVAAKRVGQHPPTDWDRVPEKAIYCDDGSVFVQATLLAPDNSFKQALKAEMIMDTSSSYWRVHGWEGALPGTPVSAYAGKPEDGIEPLATTVTTDHDGSPMIDLAAEAKESAELRAALDAGEVWFVVQEMDR